MLGSTGGLVGSSGEGGSSSYEGGGGGEVVGSSSIMSGGIGDDEKGHGSGGGEFFEGDRGTGGNRWPRQETLALLKIRSDMDGVFRDSSLKGPLWEDISRKMAELGYHRSSKKCKEKFENVYKYNKRTKDGRVGKSEGKTYRFFDQLEALEQHHSSSSPFPPPPLATPHGSRLQTSAQAAVPVTMVIPAGVTVTSSSHPLSVVQTPQGQLQHQMNVAPLMAAQQQHHHPHGPMPAHYSTPIQMDNGSSPSSSSLSASDDEVLGRRERKRKWEDFFERLTKEVIGKQEELQKRFLDVVEKCERDRLAREEAWKAQEMDRLNREREVLAQERSMAAAKDAALMAFLQQLSDQQQVRSPLPVQIQPQPQPHIGGAVPEVVSNATTIITQLPPQPKPMFKSEQPQPQVLTQARENPISLATPIPAQPQILPKVTREQALVVANYTMMNPNVDIYKTNDGENSNQQLQASSSRWPKAEVETLINIRTKMDDKYQESGPKGPLWEEISSSMKKLGYNRNAKRCKEKWENINKYFKKVKESNKRRPEDSKTCPYFHQLDALYRRKTPKLDITTTISLAPSNALQEQMKPENLNTMGPVMAQPQQQWPGQDSDDDGEDYEDDDDDDDDEGSGGYEIVANDSK